MNYVYDVTLNLNEKLFDFFDWNKTDKIIHIKKIPIFKIKEDVLKNIISFKVKLEESFFRLLQNKAEIWNMSTSLQTLALFCDNNTVIALEFDNDGNSIKKSFLNIEEELDILEMSNRVKEKNIDIKILKKETITFETRKEIKDKEFINKELKIINDDKLDYIYFECFGKKEKNKHIILNNLKNLSKDSKAYKNLYNILKLTSTTKR